MKIIHTTARFYPYMGGTEQVVHATCKELLRRGHEVSVVCADEPRGAFGVVDGIPIRRLPYITKFANSNITLPLAKALMAESFDILHTHLPHPWTADISALVSLKKRKPIFITYHNDILGKGLNSLVAKVYNATALKLLLGTCRKIFTTNQAYVARSKYLKQYETKLIYAPLGVDRERFCVKEDIPQTPKTIFFLSVLDEFHRYKGLDHLLEACAILVRKDKDIKLMVGGGGGELEAYERMARKLKIDRNVKFLGRLSDEDVVKCYNMCSVFVLPTKRSNQEGFGLVALEAMACKRAVVVTEIPAVSQDVDKFEAGLVVAPENREALSLAIEKLVYDDNLRERMAENAYSLLKKKYNWASHVDVIEAEYQRV